MTYPGNSILAPLMLDRPATRAARGIYQIVDESTPSLTYFGMRRDTGVTAADAGWLIWVEYYGTDGQWHSKYANDTASYTYIWNSRASYFPGISVSPSAPPTSPLLNLYVTSNVLKVADHATRDALTAADGDIVEIIMVRSALTADEITKVNTYLKAKWGIT